MSGRNTVDLSPKDLRIQTPSRMVIIGKGASRNRMVLFLGFFYPPPPRGSIHMSERGFFLELFDPPPP